MCKLDLNAAYLSVPTEEKLEKVCKISEEDRSLRVYVPMFWTMSSTTVTYKVIENSNLTTEKNQHQKIIY